MTFSEMVLACESADNTFNSTFDKCVKFMEASYTEYKTNLKEANLKVIQESGTPDDLVYLEDKASEGFLVRSAKTIGKIIESFLKWIKERIEAIKSFFTSKKTKETLDRAEKACKENPSLKNKKVTIPDYDKQIAVCDKYENAYNKKLAAMNAGHFSKSDKEDCDKLKKDFEKDSNAARTVTITLTVAAALGYLYKKYKDSTGPDASDISAVKGTGDYCEDPENAEAYTQAAVDMILVKKERSNKLFNCLKDTTVMVVHAMADERAVEPSLEGDDDESPKKSKKDKETTESAMDESIQESYIREILESLDDKDDSVSESVNADDIKAQESTEDTANDAIAAYLEEVCNEVISDKYIEVSESELGGFDPELELAALEAELNIEDGAVIAESTEEFEMVTAEEYLESMEAELFGDDETIEESASDEYARLNSILENIESLIE